ncbi:putative NADH-dependent flavin oxidoreductase [Mycobacterium antarcticum]|uniref:alkene reductase n=1 Tax=Mycolicibacterium sp. TUM20983 TaxID=3023369 RepID=UPI002392E405|nr:alkene reductase [Mycolicibacterium sp. TUM20983]GLP73767.1 putative NADH-dependent flavin oxidoreductase [Mycolicibacterium sp. TUM20983]
MAYSLATDAALLVPVQIGGTVARNRMFMAPLTRSRAQADGTPSDLAARYYSQRAAAGLIISEATAVSAAANGAYLNTPGLYTDRHQGKWSEIARAVHAADGQMFVQLWHVGRMGHPDISGLQPVAPSAIAADVTTHTPSGKKPLPTPRALATDEIAPIVEDFRAAARRAIDAGMDGVEIHGANGYLLHEFLSDVTNRRTDRYGGSAGNRARLTAEIVEAVAAEIGADRVGLRISPGNGAGDMREVDEVAAYEALLTRLAPLDIAYLHVLIDPDVPAFGAIRGLWFGPLVLNTGRERETRFCQLEELAEWGVISAAAVGRAFLANPDLIDRLVVGAELNEPDVPTFYAPGPVGYVDYPTLAELEQPQTA